MKRMEVVIFGAGVIGKEASRLYESKGDVVKYYIDNSPKLWGTEINNVAVIGLDRYVKERMTYLIVIAMAYKSAKMVEEQLMAGGIDNYVIYESGDVCKNGGRIVSYSDPRDKEDVVLYHLLKDKKKIFYIDIGSNDPFRSNVTKLFYDMKNACGINIEPKKVLADLTRQERPRDITLQIGVGQTAGEMILYCQEGGSTCLEENVILRNGQQEKIKIYPLKEVCREYVQEGQEISFMKIDVEGAEEQVLLGADFKQYRPEIICIESTLPRTEIPCHGKWEYILTENQYVYAFAYGINRYYIAKEHMGEYEEACKTVLKIDEIYNIYHPVLNITW